MSKRVANRKGRRSKISAEVNSVRSDMPESRAGA